MISLANICFCLTPMWYPRYIKCSKSELQLSQALLNLTKFLSSFFFFTILYFIFPCCSFSVQFNFGMVEHFEQFYCCVGVHPHPKTVSSHFTHFLSLWPGGKSMYAMHWLYGLVCHLFFLYLFTYLTLYLMIYFD